MIKPEFWIDWRDDGVKVTGWVYEIGKPRGTKPVFYIEGNHPGVGGGIRTSYIYRLPDESMNTATPVKEGAHE